MWETQSHLIWHLTQCQVCQHRIEIDRSSSATKGIVAVKIEPISANEGCTRLWKSEIHFDGIFEGLRVFGRRMGNDDYISQVVVAAVGQLEVEPWLG
jgi:hypothetical protein